MTDDLWPHSWGYADSKLKLNSDYSLYMTGSRYRLCGYNMPDFIPFVEQCLEMKIDWGKPLEEEQTKFQSSHSLDLYKAFYTRLTEQFPASQISLDEQERLRHSHGQTIEEIYSVLHSTLKRTVDLVFYAQAEQDLITLVNLAVEFNVCLVPFGGGTNVSRALELPVNEKRLIIAVNLLAMNQLLWIDKKNYRACVQAGMTGSDLEKELAKSGFTSGHIPDSIELSTLGGWIATNASGMKKNRYGNIEDIVEKISFISSTGKLEQKQAIPRASMGMRPQQLWFGCEGNLGIISEAIIKIHPLPDIVKYDSFVFPSFERGVDFLNQLAHSGLLPASVRLVDNLQFALGQTLKPPARGWHKLFSKIQKWYLFNLKKINPKKIAAMTVVMEGEEKEVRYQHQKLTALAKQYQGISGGAANGEQGYLLTYAIAYLATFLMPYRIIGETFETTVPWSSIQPLCEKVNEVLHKEHLRHKLPGKPFLSYRISQLYHSGVCLYFTFVIHAGDHMEPAKLLSDIEYQLRKSVMDNGGSISHHHGVGKIRKDFMSQTLSEREIHLLKTIKKSLDPDNIFAIGNNVFDV